MRKPIPDFYYGWMIVAVSFITLFISLGVRISFGVFYVAILKDFGWTRAETAGAFSIAMFVHACFAPISGFLIDRFSPRKLFPMGAACLTLGLLAASLIHQIWHLYFYFGVIVAIGINIIGFGPHMALIPRWFIRKRGLANGVALSGIGLGSLMVAPLIGFIIKAVNWRSAFLILAGIVFFVVVPATALFQRRSPEEMGRLPDNADPGDPATLPTGSTGDRGQGISGGQRDWTLRTAAKTGPFWWVNLTGFCHGFMVNLLIVHQAIYIVDCGFTALLAASILGLVGFLGSFGGIVFGFLSDRMGRKGALSMGCAAAFMGMIFLILLENRPSPGLLFAFTVLYGMGQGSFSPIYASTMGDLFSGPSLGRIMSTLSIGYGFGGAMSSYMGGYFHDITGTYLVPFLFLLACIFTGALGIWMAAPAKGRP